MKLNHKLVSRKQIQLALGRTMLPKHFNSQDGAEHNFRRPLEATPKPSRNSLCPCGSEKKYKACCMRKEQ